MANNENLKPVDSQRAAEIGRLGGYAKKGKKHINTWVQELLHDDEFQATIRKGYDIVDFKGAPIKAIVQAQIIKALDGDTKAYDSLVKSGWATKIEQDITSNGETIGTNDPSTAAEFAEFLKSKGK
jgi:hypothetical protein